MSKCTTHPKNNSIGKCTECKRDVCDLCSTAFLDKLYCPQCIDELVGGTSNLTKGKSSKSLIEMKVNSINVGPVPTERIVVLKEKGGDRGLALLTDIPAAESIMVILRGVKNIPRPLTHDMTLSIIDALNGKVNRVIISKVNKLTFFSDLVLTVDKKKVIIDCRPTDAIAVAIRAQAPIFVKREVLISNGFIFNDKKTEEIQGAKCPSCGQEALFVETDGKISCKMCGEIR